MSPASPAPGPSLLAEASALQFPVASGTLSPPLAPLPPIITSGGLLQASPLVAPQDFSSLSFQQASIFSPQKEDGHMTLNNKQSPEQKVILQKPNVPQEVKYALYFGGVFGSPLINFIKKNF